MDNIKALYGKITQLRQEIDKKHYDVEHATQASLDHGLAEDYSRANSEAGTALRCMHEIDGMEMKVIDIEQQIVAVEQHIARLQQQDITLRESNMHHVAHIDRDTKQKLDDLTRQIRALRG